MEELKKSYFAIIPANVRYDNDIKPNAKLLFGEITALCNEKGYCWASNNYFAELFNCTERSIQMWLNDLARKNYIQIKIEYKEGSKEVARRVVKIFSWGGEKIFVENNTKLNKENSIIDNTTKENKSRIPTYEEIVEYFKERQTNIDPKEFYDYYQSVGWFRGNTKITNWKNCLTTWETKRKKKPQQQPTQQVHNFEERTYTEEDYDQVVTSIDNIDFNDL